MPRSAQYTPARRACMQITLLAILAAAVGLAALVDHALAARSHVDLGAVENIGPLHIQLPSGWAVTGRSLRDPTIRAIATEPDQADNPRVLVVYRQRLRDAMDPDSYLQRSGLLASVFANPASELTEDDSGHLCGQPAVLVHGQTLSVAEDGSAEIRSEILLCSVLSNRQAVTLRLSKIGDLDRADDLLLQQVAASVKMDGL